MRRCAGMEIKCYVRLISFQGFLVLESVIYSLTFDLFNGASLSGFVACKTLVRSGVDAIIIDYVSFISFRRF